MSSSQPPAIPPTENASTVIAQWRLQILNNLLWILVVLGGLALVVGSWSDYNAMGERALPYIAIYTIAYVLVVSAAALRQLSLTIRAIFVLTILGAMATFC